MSVKRAELVILVVLILAVPLPMAQLDSPGKNTATMSDREQNGLRGLVKSRIEESTHPPITDAAGKNYPEVHLEYTTEYDADGRILSNRSRNSDGSEFVTNYVYDASGRLQRITSGVEGQALTQRTYSYDQLGRLQKISDDSRADTPILFHYDERGRKTKIETSRPEDYRLQMAQAGSPFEIADRPPNLLGGGSATTIYDEHDRPTEVQVRDANGELVNRAFRIYDAQGHVVEEKQVLDNPETMIPAEDRAKMLEESGLSADQLQQELRAHLTKLMAGHSGPYSVSYRYHTHGRVTHANRRIFNRQEEIETVYNEQGDAESEITRERPLDADPATPNPSLPRYSEVRYSYQYDQHGNWTEKRVSYRSTPGGTFEPSTVIKRTLAYY